MLRSNYFTQSGFCYKLYVPHSIKQRIKRGLEKCIFLCLPEDTTENGDPWHSDYRNIGLSKTRSTAKVVFWLVISIAATLAVGQLK